MKGVQWLKGRQALIALLSAAAAIAVVAGVLRYYLARELQREVRQLAEARHQQASMPATNMPLTNPMELALSRFTARKVTAQQLAGGVQQVGGSLGVSLTSVASTLTAASPQTLGREEVTLTLTGSYPNLKTVLSETLDRHPGVVLHRMAFRRLNAPADLQLQAGLLLLSSPARAEADAGRSP
jgi:hypothetical protein